MPKNKFQKFFQTVLFGGLFVFTPAKEWTLTECLERAKSSGLTMQSAKLSEQRASVSLQQAKNDRYPTLSASVNQRLYDSPFRDVPQDHYSLSLGLSGSLRLWDGGSTGLSIEARTLDLASAKHRTVLSELQVQEAVMNAYLSLLAAMENTVSVQKSLTLSGELYQNKKNLLDAGMITPSDFALAESDLALGRVNLITAEQSENNRRTVLRQLLELSRLDSFSVSAAEFQMNSPDSLEALPDYETALAEIRKNNPGLLADSLSLLSAQKAVKIAGKTNSISVTLGANASSGFTAWESDAYGHQMKDGYNHSLSLGINIPIIDGGTAAANILSAQVAAAQANIARMETEKNLENQMETLYLNALSADAQWKAALIQLKAQEEVFRVSGEQEQAGTISYTDFLEQKNRLDHANTTFTQAKYSSLLARRLLDLYRGKYL